MIPSLILVISVAALLQFFVSYCRSVIAESRQVKISDQVREMTRVDDRNLGAEEFGRLVQLVQLCPEPGDDRVELRAVRTYFGLLGVARALLRSLAPRISLWLERERAGCAYFAAVALDHRIAFNRDVMARQASNRF